MNTRKNNSTTPTKSSHPVFSDFAYLPSVEGLSFAVGLREEDGDEEVIIKAFFARVYSNLGFERL